LTLEGGPLRVINGAIMYATVRIEKEEGYNLRWDWDYVQGRKETRQYRLQTQQT